MTTKTIKQTLHPKEIPDDQFCWDVYNEFESFRKSNSNEDPCYMYINRVSIRKLENSGFDIEKELELKLIQINMLTSGNFYFSAYKIEEGLYEFWNEVNNKKK
jgi:hypothetical protein